MIRLNESPVLADGVENISADISDPPCIHFS